MIPKDYRIAFDQGDLDEAGAAIVAALPKVAPATAARVARIAFEAIGMEPNKALIAAQHERTEA